MKKIVAITILSLSTFVSFGQVPGYMGKRYSLNYNFGFFNQLSDGSRPKYNSALNFNTTHMVELDYVVSRKSSLAISFLNYNDEFNTTLKGKGNGYVTGNNTNSSESYTISASGRKADINVSKIELNYKMFTSNSIAPIGMYNQLGIGLITYSITPFGDDGNGYFIYDDVNSNNEITISQLKIDNFKTVDMLGDSRGYGLNLNYTLGTQMIIQDWIFLRASISLNYPILGVPVGNIIDYDYEYIDQYGADDTINKTNYYHQLGKMRIFSRDFLVFNLGTGIIFH